MEGAVSLGDVANIVTFIAPGYFAIQVYSIVYAKRDRDFSRLVIESVIYSLPIVALTNLMWQKLFGQEATTALSAKYALFLLLVAVAVGVVCTALRTRWPVKAIAEKFGLGSPNEDFVKTQLLRINAADSDNNAVVVKLRSGAVFSGTVDRLSRYATDGPKYYYFANLAWLDKKGSWDEREGGIIIERSEIEYIETPPLQDE